jgi:two-component system, cell cycle response regulator
VTDPRDRQLQLLQKVAAQLPFAAEPGPLFEVVARELQAALGAPRIDVALRERRLGELRLPGDPGDGERVEHVVPLRGGELDGELTVGAPGRAPFAADEVRLLETLGDLLSGALTQGLLFEQSLRNNALLGRLDDISRQINTCHEIGAITTVASSGLADLMASDAFAIYVLTEGVPNLLASDGPPDTFPQSVVVVGRSGRPLLGRAGSAEIRIGRSELGGRPIWVELLRGSNAALGLVAIRMQPDAPDVTEEMRLIISALAGHLAVAIHNTLLLAELRHHATFDDLTGLAGRRHFMEELRREIDRARREARPLTMLSLDADHFKAINDRWGHPAGDEVLRALADALKIGTRSLDVVGRLGGEEFGVLLPGADESIAAMVAERLRRTIATLEIPWRDEVLRIRVSVGVAPWGPEMGPDDLLELVDRAMYAAKEQGRDRVVSMSSLATVEMAAPTTPTDQ